jgi:predicted GNAT family acetyltransferase
MLYVDDDNTAAMRLYASLGFERYACDVAYVRRQTAPTPPRR